MTFHWTGQNYGAAVDFFVNVPGCIGVLFVDGVLCVRVKERTLHFEPDTVIDGWDE